MDTFDYVIVGAGAAGSVLAYRLGEQGHSVCVIEAGPSDSNPYIRVPAGFMKTYNDESITWPLVHQGSPGTNGRAIPFIQGKVLGGSSSVNGMVYSRGQASDFDNWCRSGNKGWSYQDVLPYFRKDESFKSGGDDQYRGRDGGIPITTTSWRDDACESFIRGAVESGIPCNDDYNGSAQAGVGYCQSAIYRGKRWSASHGYLQPARKKYDVTILTGAVATRIVVEGKHAKGVEYLRTGSDEPKSVKSRLFTVISAGAVNSPKLLQLSGIGPGKLLQERGIPVVLDLPGVGENLRDHYAARLVARARPGVKTINDRASGLPLVKEVLAWLLGRPSILAVSPILVYGFWKSDAALSETEFALSFTPASYKLGMTRRLDDFPGFTCGAWRLRPESRGYVRIESNDHRVNPVIQPNFLEHENDRRIMVAGLKWARKITKTDAMKNVLQAEILPGAACETDDEWIDFARQYGMSSYHLVGTCKMGPSTDPFAVVDSELRVHGIDGLAVIDASVMPTSPSGNTIAATMMIAEKGADGLLADRKWPSGVGPDLHHGPLFAAPAPPS